MGQENVFYDILEGKNAFLRFKKKVQTVDKNEHFSKGVNPWFWSKNENFSNFFLRNIGQGNVVYDILQRNNVFLGYKNKKFKKSKKWHFSKGFNPWFLPKMAIFQIFLLDNIGQENVFYDILERRKAFLGYKNKTLKKSKNCHFSKGFNSWFWSKKGHFPTFFFRQYRPRKCLLRYSRRNKAFPGYKNKKIKGSQKLTFFQRG